MERKFTLFIIVFAILTFSCVNHKKEFTIQQGDILFQDLDCGDLCDAIENVTQGVDSARLSHIGIVVIDEKGNPFVIEAYGKHVSSTPLNRFLNRTKDSNKNPKVLVGRIKDNYNELIDPAVSYAKTLIGKPYDDTFVINSDDFYCSELIFYSFMMANNGKPLFLLSPMTFKEVGKDQFNPAWVEYYEKLKCEIPEGEPGINPGAISRSEYIEIVHVYGKPDGYTK